MLIPLLQGDIGTLGLRGLFHYLFSYFLSLTARTKININIGFEVGFVLVAGLLHMSTDMSAGPLENLL